MNVKALYIGRDFTGITICKDATWPGMWRVRSTDRQLSDMVNLTRAKDAAISRARPRGLGGKEVVRWDNRETAVAADPVRFDGESLSAAAPAQKNESTKRIGRLPAQSVKTGEEAALPRSRPSSFPVPGAVMMKPAASAP
jgi:hypothetical protein